MMSSDEKIGSRYNHVACILSQLSMMSWRSLSVFSQSTILSKNGPMYLQQLITPRGQGPLCASVVNTSTGTFVAYESELAWNG